MRPEMTEKQWCLEFEARMRAMEAGMARLDKEGLFGREDERLQIVIAAKVMPPDQTNVGRVRRLNPEAAIQVWLEEVAEPEEP